VLFRNSEDELLHPEMTLEVDGSIVLPLAMARVRMHGAENAQVHEPGTSSSEAFFDRMLSFGLRIPANKVESDSAPPGQLTKQSAMHDELATGAAVKRAARASGWRCCRARSSHHSCNDEAMSLLRTSLQE
jgi:hypothetical protein